MGFCTYTFQYNKHHTVSQYIHRASVCVWFLFSNFMRELHRGQTLFYTSNKAASETFIKP